MNSSPIDMIFNELDYAEKCIAIKDSFKIRDGDLRVSALLTSVQFYIELNHDHEQASLVCAADSKGVSIRKEVYPPQLAEDNRKKLLSGGMDIQSMATRVALRTKVYPSIYDEDVITRFVRKISGTSIIQSVLMRVSFELSEDVRPFSSPKAPLVEKMVHRLTVDGADVTFTQKERTVTFTSVLLDTEDFSWDEEFDNLIPPCPTESSSAKPAKKE